MDSVTSLVNHLDSQQPTQASAAKHGFAGLPCLHCGNVESITLQLNDMTGDDAIFCSGCDATFSVDDVRETLTKWQSVLTWIDSAPLLKE